MEKIKMLLIVLYILLTTMLLSCLALLGNVPVMFYSFIGFIGLGVLLSFPPFDNYTKIAMYTSISLIFFGCLIYFSISAYSKSAMNMATIGYYLLISASLSLFLHEINLPNTRFGKTIRFASDEIVYFISSNGMKPAYVVLITALLLFSLPVWPVGAYIVPIPVTMRLNLDIPQQAYSGLLLLNFNSSVYAYLENSNISNIRFSYLNGTAIPAYIQYNSSYSYNTPVILRLDNPSDTITMNFMPAQLSFNSTLIGINASRFKLLEKDATNVNYSLEMLTMPVGVPYTNKTVIFPIGAPASLEQLQTMVLFPPYTLQNICTQGTNTKAKLTIMSDLPVSVFILGSMDNFSNATVGAHLGIMSSTYLKRFLANSYMYVVNESSANFTSAVQDNSCLPYSIVAERDTRVIIYTNITYMHQVLVKKTGSVPSPIFGEHYNFLPYSIAYLYNVYINQTSKITA